MRDNCCIDALNHGKVQIFWNDTNRSELHLRGNQEQTEFRECFVSCSSESFVSPLLSNTVEDKNTQNRTTCFVWVWNLVCHVKEEHRLIVFQNSVTRRVFGPKRDEVTEG
jgi:hypothetical protein